MVFSVLFIFLNHNYACYFCKLAIEVNKCHWVNKTKDPATLNRLFVFFDIRDF